MNAPRENALEQLYGQYRLDHDRLRTELAVQLAAETPPCIRRRTITERLGFRALVGLAASLLVAVAVGMGFVLLFSPSTIYAKVLNSLKSVRSAHLVAQRQQDGGPSDQLEAWYDRTRGTFVKSQRHGRTTLRLDDGTHQWYHESGSRQAIRTKSAGPLAPLVECMNPERALKHAERDVQGDTTIDGIACLLYRSMSPDETRRNSIWIDPAYRIRRVREESLRNGQWVSTGSITVEYEVPIDPDRFATNFGPDVGILDATNLLDERFSPAQAIYKEDRMGLVIAVHELRRVNERMAFVVFSTRATDATVRRLGPLRSFDNGKHLNGSITYGDLNLLVRGKRDERTHKWLGSFQTVTLAYCCHDGIRIEWALVYPTGPWPARFDALEFGGILHTRIGLAAEREKAGLPTYEVVQPLATLPLPEPTLPLSAAIAQVYEETRLLAPSAFQVSLELGGRPLTEKEIAARVARGEPEADVRRQSIGRIASPGTISLEDYRTEVEANLAALAARRKAK